MSSVDPALDAEALRIVSLMPQWQPGKQQGKPVIVFYTIPVTFK
jgi:negative regulator of sigma E activity